MSLMWRSGRRLLKKAISKDHEYKISHAIQKSKRIPKDDTFAEINFKEGLDIFMLPEVILNRYFIIWSHNFSEERVSKNSLLIGNLVIYDRVSKSISQVIEYTIS